MAKEERNKFGERKKTRVYVGSKIVGYLFLGITAILIVQATLGLLSLFGITTIMPFSVYLTGPAYIVQAFEGFFIISQIITLAFAAIGFVCFVGLLREQEWAAGISLILLGLVAVNMILHLVINPGIFGSLNLILEIIVFGIAAVCIAYIVKNFKRFD